MIHITKDQAVFENDTMRVFSPTGDYQDNDLIEVYDSTQATVVSGAFAAQYIKYGGLVYKFNEPQELGEAILLIDPKSTHAAASLVRMKNELLSMFNGGELQPSSLQQTLDTEQQDTEQRLDDESDLDLEDIQKQIDDNQKTIDELKSEIKIDEPVTTGTSTETSIESGTTATSTPANTTPEPSPVTPTPALEESVSEAGAIEQIIAPESIDVPQIDPVPLPESDQPLSILTKKGSRRMS